MPRHKSRKLFKLKLTKSKLLTMFIATVVILGVSGLAWARYGNNDGVSTQPESVDNTSSDGSAINLSPATEEERQQAEDHKQELTNEQTTTQSSESKKQVTPVIVNADRNGANAYVSGVFEDGGTCTATFIYSQDKITANSKGFKNVSYTSCEPINLPGPLTIDGTWTVTVSYSSSTAAGQSSPWTFEVN